ncbi:prepilin-type N-terminal cleavage/methylation domain-containing protein [Cytobacillus oceanisediminis]|nr:prepilin-type N-terminal cleavage/methylation domain-containing protein [Cytobacillus oceanisediminis]
MERFLLIQEGLTLVELLAVIPVSGIIAAIGFVNRRCY